MQKFIANSLFVLFRWCLYSNILEQKSRQFSLHFWILFYNKTTKMGKDYVQIHKGKP